MEVFDRLPIWSVLALLITWFGIGFYCHKMYQGLEEVIVIIIDMFPKIVPFFEKLKTGLLVIAFGMACITLLMAIVGMFTTTHCRGTFRHGVACEHRRIDRLKSKFGSSVACTIFMVLNYLLYICWIAVFAMTVAVITVYYAFSPICLPRAGHHGAMCFNFSSFALMLANGNPRAVVELSLCGHPISQLCKLTKAFAPWNLSAFIGCFLILVGLNHFTACLAANFAHNRRAGQFVKFCVSRSVTPDDIVNSEIRESGFNTPAELRKNSSSTTALTGKPSKSSWMVNFVNKPPPTYSNSIDFLPESPKGRRNHISKPRTPSPTPV